MNQNFRNLFNVGLRVIINGELSTVTQHKHGRVSIKNGDTETVYNYADLKKMISKQVLIF